MAHGTEAILRRVVAASPIGMSLLDADGAILMSNEPMAALLGRSAAELSDVTWQGVTHPDDVPAEVELMARVAAGGQDSYRLSKRYLRPDGEVVWADQSVTCVRNDETGACEAWVVQAEVAVFDRGEDVDPPGGSYFESLLDPHVSTRVVRDASGRVVDLHVVEVNEAACAAMGKPRADVVGARISQVVPGRVSDWMIATQRQTHELGAPLVLDNHESADAANCDGRIYDVRAVSDGEVFVLSWREVTDRHESASQLAASEKKYRLLAENSSDVVLHLRHGLVEWVSPSLFDGLGWMPSDWIGQQIFDFVHPEDRQRLAAANGRVQQGERAYGRYRLRARDGVHHWVEGTANKFVKEHGEVDGLAASFSLADAKVAAELELAQRAHFDQLTGLLNRAAIFDTLKVVFREAAADGSGVAVAFCDLDGFKEINDTHGHQMGDFVLKSFAEHLRLQLRGQDIVARLGGDEFLVVLLGVKDVDEAIGIAQRVCEHAGQPHDYEGIDYVPHVSIGVALASSGEPIDEVIARADAAMYKAKAAGGNRVVAAA